MRSIAPALITGAAVIVTFSTLGAQQPRPTYKRDLPAELVKQAKVSEERAARTALAKVPAGYIGAVELERDSGRLVYSYEIKVSGKRGFDEVNVNAKTGEVVDVEHELPAREPKDAKAEKKKG